MCDNLNDKATENRYIYGFSSCQELQLFLGQETKLDLNAPYLYNQPTNMRFIVLTVTALLAVAIQAQPVELETRSEDLASLDSRSYYQCPMVR